MYEVFIKRVDHSSFLPANVVSSNKLGCPMTKHSEYNIPLNYHEQRQLLPDYFNLSMQDPRYATAVDDLFKRSIVINIPHETNIEGTGKRLDITIRSVKDGKEVAPVKNNKAIRLTDEAGNLIYRPDNIIEYIQWRNAMEHPNVANHPDQKLSTNKMFYIEDTTYRKRKRVSMRVREEQAFEKYIAIKKKEERDVAVFYTMLTGKNPRDYDSMMDEIHSLLKNSPHKFDDIEVNEDYSFAAIAKQAIEKKKLKRKGKYYFYEDTNLGDSQKAVENSISKPENSAIYAHLRAQLGYEEELA